MSKVPDFQTVVLAAGRGTRMKSSRAKVLHEIMDEPMLGYVVRAANRAGSNGMIGVVGHQKERVEEAFRVCSDSEKVACAHQKRQAGTAHAVEAASEQIRGGSPYTLVLSGDVPTLDSRTLGEFVREVVQTNYDAGVMTARVEDPEGYGRVVIRGSEQIQKIVEHPDATAEERAINRINAGVYLVKTELLIDAVEEICSGEADNAQAEYYLPELVEVLDVPVMSWTVDDPSRVYGVNTRRDLAHATHAIQRRINREWMDRGVTLISPRSVYVGPEVELSRDVELGPDVTVTGQTFVGQNTRIERGSVIRDATIRRGTLIRANCYIQGASVGADSDIGPMGRLRPGADVGRGCRVGNFVEVKKARLEDGAKAGHLAYLGDAHIGEEANIGAGTITCNYDGVDKHQTIIGAGAFTGSNSALVAPVELGDGAYVGAGSVITKDVPSGQLGLGRARQTNIADWQPPEQTDAESDRNRDD